MTTQNATITGLLAVLAIGAMFVATEASAKIRAHNAASVPQSRNAGAPAQGYHNIMAPGIYESFSGNRHLYVNPDRDFSTAGERDFFSGDSGSGPF